MQPNQYQLLTQRRFLPLFIVQFLGALNDNIFKTSLLMLIAITFATQSPQKASVLNNLGAAAFIFPYFLFSATAGQLADKYDKRKLIHWLKFFEIVISLLIGIGFWWGNFNFLIGILFLLGIQATFFGPVKYSILPQYLSAQELMGGNGLVEMGTFVAILVGTIIGGLLVGHENAGMGWITWVVFFIALCGWLSSLRIPPSSSPSNDAQLHLNWEPFSQTFHTLKEASLSPLLFLAMLSISWFWFYGSLIITQIPTYTRIFLHGSPYVMTLLLMVAALGIGLGSLLCEPLSRHKKELQILTLGAIGLTIFAIDLSFAHSVVPSTMSNIGIHVFIQQVQNWRLLTDLFLIGVAGGFFSVPLYVILQKHSKQTKRSQIIAANNILNALFMTIASFLAIGLLKLGFTLPQLFLILGGLNILIAFPLLWLMKHQQL